jgi:ArsR family transcriptional regulator
MTQVYKHRPATPRQAVRRRARFDQALQPDLLKALAEPTRARLLSCLLKCGRACSVTEVAACCDLDFSMVARHLAHLARAGALEAQKDGRTMWYTANADVLASHFRELAAAVDELANAAEPACDCCTTNQSA